MKEKFNQFMEKCKQNKKKTALSLFAIFFLFIALGFGIYSLTTVNEDSENDTLQGLEGVEFTFTSDTTGKVVKKIVTDKNGFATTVDKNNPRGGLLFDTYTVTETKCPEGLKPIEPFKVTIKEEGVTLRGIYKEDKIIVSPVSVVKVDASTGKVIPVANTEFRLLDENKKPIQVCVNKVFIPQ